MRQAGQGAPRALARPDALLQRVRPERADEPRLPERSPKTQEAAAGPEARLAPAEAAQPPRQRRWPEAVELHRPVATWEA